MLMSKLDADEYVRDSPPRTGQPQRNSLLMCDDRDHECQKLIIYLSSNTRPDTDNLINKQHQDPRPHEQNLSLPDKEGAHTFVC